jgi:SnoaL-like domain
MSPGDLDPVLQRVADELAISRIMVNYARGVDRRDFDLVRSCFLPEAVIQGTSFGGPRDEYLEILLSGVMRYPKTMHFIGNQHREVDGDNGRTETYLIAHHFADEQGEIESLIMGVRYHDQVRRTEDGTWGIVRRDVDCDWRRWGKPLS